MNYILDADIRSYFDSVSQDWLIRFLKHRINDLRMIRLIQKWLKAGILEDGIITVSETGTGQGSVASPLLSNIYLHYVFDLWAERWRRRQATGDMIIVRYADDIIIGFQHESDARRLWDAMRERLREFSLLLHPDKTRLIRFGRFAATQRAERGLGKPETFTFLGFTLICGKTRQGRFALQRKSRGCVSAWNKDPVFGVIGIQSGPRGKGPQWLPSSHGSRGWNAGGGDDCQDPSRLFC